MNLEDTVRELAAAAVHPVNPAVIVAAMDVIAAAREWREPLADDDVTGYYYCVACNAAGQRVEHAPSCAWVAFREALARWDET